MKSRDVLHHLTLINYNITLKTIQMCVLGFSAQSLQVHVLEWPKVKHSNKAREAYEQNPSAPTLPGWVKRRAGSSVVKDWTTWLYNEICAMLNSCTSTQKQTLISQEIDGIKRWWPSWTMLPDMTHIYWNNTIRFKGIPGIPGCTLMKRKITSRMLRLMPHCCTSFQNSENLIICTVLQLDWFLTIVYKLI